MPADNREATMTLHRSARICERPRATAAALLLLVTVTATWLWAHAGHKPLPAKGAAVDVAKGQVVLSRAARDALDVRTVEIGLRPLEESFLAYATLVAPWQRHAYVSARLAGRIDKIHVRPGETVTAGQSLAEVQSLDLKNLQLEVINARNEVLLSGKNLAQLEQAGRGVAAQRLVEARTKAGQDAEALQIAHSKWLSLGLADEDFERLVQDRDLRRLPSLPIRSLVGGVVIHADLTVGKVVGPTEHLFEVVDLSTVWVKIGVLERDLHRVAPGQPVILSLAAYPGEVFESTVRAKELSLDPQTHLGTVWAELTNPTGNPRFLPGMNGQARLILRAPRPRPAVPAEALVTDGVERYVLVEESATPTSSQYQKQNVIVGRRTPAFVEILGGNVFPGDRVVTRGSHELAGFFFQGVLRPGPEAARNIGLRVEAVRRHVVEEVVEVDGSVDVPPDRRTFASSQLDGILQQIHIAPGQVVAAGQVIAEVASLELQNLQLDLLRADLESRLQEVAVRRIRAAGAGLAGRQLQEAENLSQAARNRRESLREKLLVVGLSRKQIDTLLQDKKVVQTLPLRAPLAGSVVHFNKVLGQTIKAEDPLFEIHDLSKVWVQGYVSERVLARVRIGQRVRVRLVTDPEFLAAGVVVRSGRVLGTEDRALSVWVELDKDPGRPLPQNLLAGLTLTVRRPQPTLAVPLGAVVHEDLRAYVFVREKDGTFGRRLVETGRADDRFVEIRRGLRPDEQVAVQGAADLQTAYASLR